MRSERPSRLRAFLASVTDRVVASGGASDLQSGGLLFESQLGN
jgi:hypothetical protein